MSRQHYISHKSLGSENSPGMSLRREIKKYNKKMKMGFDFVFVSSDLG